MDTVELVPADVLFGSTARTAPAISPDGRRLVFVGPLDGVANLFVTDVGSDGARPLTHDTARGVHTFQWAPDGRHVIFEQDTGGDENWQLFLCDVDTGETRALVAQPGVRALVLGVQPDNPDVIAIALNADDPQWYDAYHLTLATGELTKVGRNEQFTRWVVDPQLRARGAVRSTGARVEVLVRDGHDQPWRTVLELDGDDAFHVQFDVFPMRFSDDGRWLYLISSLDADTTRLLRVDVTSGAVEPVGGLDGGDILWAHFQPRTHAPQLLVVPTDRAQYVVCDPALEADVETLRLLHDGDLNLLSRDAADRLWTVEFTSDRGSRAYFLYDRSTRTGRLLFHAQPELEELPLAAMEPFAYSARDGLEIAGYLFFPPGRPRRNLPTIHLLHGGPANRWFWGFHPLAQLLANRGYLVMMTNFRGSLGYGKRFLAAGNRQWARAMHTDVVDANEWVVAQGYADREKIGLWGGSYGGYEVLVAVTHDPDLVTCAVAQVAPVNLVTLLRSIPPYWDAERAYFRRALGDDEADLWDRSPLRLADRIKVPLLLFYGEKDPRVPVSEARQLAEALERNGIAHELHVIPDEGHSLGTTMSPEHRDDYVSRLERFYAEHLGGRSAT